ncbi:MAG: DUF3524 domain-containing protein [Chitinophagales bacterium]
MNITIIDPFMGQSHKKWAEGFQKHSKHKIEILGLPGKFWKWRMYGGAVTLANEFINSRIQSDLILASDMLDLNVFLSLCRKEINTIPVALYFHENQLTYPLSERDKMRNFNNNFSFINYASALAADKVLFNSNFHKESFIDALPGFLEKFPDHQNLNTIDTIAQKSKVLHLGMDLKSLDIDHVPKKEKKERAILLWNHRWEYDKNPDDFFKALFELQDRGIEFQLIVLGEARGKYPEIFDRAKKQLDNEIIHWGYAKDFETYKNLLWKADILPVTSNQDFFGGSVIEAAYCNCIPLLPKRLAYPEHFPEIMHKSLFYEEGQFVNKLQRMIMDVNVLRNQNTQKFVKKYDWNEIIENYDNCFEQIITKK